MKTVRLSLVLIILFGMLGYSQQKQQKLKPYKAQIILTNGDKIKGIFYSVAEDSIVLTDKRNNKIVLIPSNVQWIKLRQKNKLVNGALIGGASGALLGGIVALVGSRESPIIQDSFFGVIVDGPDFVEPDTTFEFIAGGALIGSITGAAITSKKIKYFINGNRQMYLSKLARLQSYTLVNLANR